MTEGNGYWRDRSVLVTGATGLLGGWLLKKLLADRARPVCLVRDWVPDSEATSSGDLGRANVVRGDVRDQATVERIVGEYEVETVFHLAAQTIVPIANRNPASTFESNVGGTWALLEACRRSPTVQSIVLASSDKAYGASPKLPYDEATPLRAQHPYDVSKAAGDMIATSYAATFGMPVSVTRCGNLYGGGDLNWNRIVPGTIRSVVRGERPVVRSDGTYQRDYFYVEDAVLAYTNLAERLAKDRALRGEAFNFSPEKPSTVNEVVRTILRLMESDLEPDVRSEATNEIRDQYLDSTKARRALGWKPAFTLEQGLERTIPWYRRLLT